MSLVDLLSFGYLLKRLRKTAQLTQEALAERAKLSAKEISALECGTRRHPRPATVQALANALHLSQSDRVLFEAAARRQVRRKVDDSTAQGGAAAPAPQGSDAYVLDDRLVVGGRMIRWIVLQRARYQRGSIHCSYDPAAVPLAPDLARLLSEYQRDWEERREKRGEVGFPYNAEMYKLKRFQMEYRHRGSRGEEVSELFLEFGPTDYLTQIVTDLNVDDPIRNQYAAAVDLKELPVPEFASGMSVNLSLITSDHFLIATRGSRQAFVAGGSFKASVGENLLRSEDAAPDGAPDPFAAARRGVLEEIGVDLRPEDIAFSAFGVNPHLCQYTLTGTIWLKQTRAEIANIRRKGIPKGKWENSQLYFVPFDLERVARFALHHWERWFPTGLATIVMSLLDAGYSPEAIDAAFERIAAE